MMRTMTFNSKSFYAGAALVLALISVAWFLANAGLGSAADQSGTPEELSQTPNGNPTMYFGGCWGRVHNPHNSSKDPREDYVQAKTDIHCNEMLAAGDTLSVTNSLFVRSSSGFWDHM